jgi:hypothetical protein
MVRPNDLFTLKDMAQHFQTHTRTIIRWVALGMIPPPAITIGKKRFWDVDQLNQLRSGEHQNLRSNRSSPRSHDDD